MRKTSRINAEAESYVERITTRAAEDYLRYNGTFDELTVLWEVMKLRRGDPHALAMRPDGGVEQLYKLRDDVTRKVQEQLKDDPIQQSMMGIAD